MRSELARRNSEGGLAGHGGTSRCPARGPSGKTGAEVPPLPSQEHQRSPERGQKPGLQSCSLSPGRNASPRESAAFGNSLRSKQRACPSGAQLGLDSEPPLPGRQASLGAAHPEHRKGSFPLLTALVGSRDLQKDRTVHLSLPGRTGGKVPVTWVKQKRSVTSLSTVCG